MDFELTGEQRLPIDSAHAFARRELAPHAADGDREHHFPLAAIRQAAEQGYLGLYIDEADGGRINIASCSPGAARAALDQSLGYVGERRQFGKLLAEFQALQFKLADMLTQLTQLTASRQMVLLTADRLDRGHPQASLYCTMAKRFATDQCFEICNEALQLHGGDGYLNDYPLERWVRGSRVHQILEGTNEIMRVIFARHLLEKGGTLEQLL